MFFFFPVFRGCFVVVIGDFDLFSHAYIVHVDHVVSSLLDIVGDFVSCFGGGFAGGSFEVEFEV